MSRASLKVRSRLQLPELENFSENPGRGEVIFKNGVMYVYTDLNTGIHSWYPMNQVQSSFIHTQSVAEDTFDIHHGLGVREVSVQCWADTGELVSPANVEAVEDPETNEWYLTVEMGYDFTGYVVVFGRNMLNVGNIEVENLTVSNTLTVSGSRVLSEVDLAAFNAMLSEAVKYGDIVNDLVSSAATGKPLSAAQGAVLKGFIDDINLALASDDTTLNEFQEVVAYIKANRASLDALSISNIAGLSDEITRLDSSISDVQSNLDTLSSNITTALAGKLSTTGTAYDSTRLGGVNADQYVLKDDTLDYGAA